MGLYQELSSRVPVTFVRYPGGSHMFLRNGRPSHRLDYSRRVVAWVEKYANAPQGEALEAQRDGKYGGGQ